MSSNIKEGEHPLTEEETKERLKALEEKKKAARAEKKKQDKQKLDKPITQEDHDICFGKARNTFGRGWPLGPEMEDRILRIGVDCWLKDYTLKQLLDSTTSAPPGAKFPTGGTGTRVKDNITRWSPREVHAVLRYPVEDFLVRRGVADEECPGYFMSWSDAYWSKDGHKARKAQLEVDSSDFDAVSDTETVVYVGPKDNSA
ncbi:hypothetical protein EJ08DRAFT_706070 [Tothia fuscella]|uniref:Uncharacterized protein n=1 Tax=Tothia fuscella TaxID=1048955 RepID=A0A9P4NWK8_9PEZI|nr:hypothetical protein EJ08DRAFT_706070 [Tothia fuscella]